MKMCVQWRSCWSAVRCAEMKRLATNMFLLYRWTVNQQPPQHGNWLGDKCEVASQTPLPISSEPAMPASRSPLLLCLLLPALAAAQCLHDGKVVPMNGLLPNLGGDACFDRVCRCESWDRCRFQLERKTVIARVNEKWKSADGQPGSVLVRNLECKCVEDLEGSREMSFYCTSPRSDNQTGCLDTDGARRPPGHRVSVETSGGDALECECDASGHYVNCASRDELLEGDGCRDANGGRVALGAAYKRTVSLYGRQVSLQCLCAKSNQETACVRLG